MADKDYKKRVVPFDSKETYLFCRISLREFTEKDYPYLRNKLEEYCKSKKNIEDYYFIFHGEKDTYHCHLLIRSVPRVRCQTLCYSLCKEFGFSENAMYVDKCLNVARSVKYFLHQDKDSISKEKKRYEIEDLVTNVPYEIIMYYLNSDKGMIDYDYLVSVVLNCRYDCEIMEKLGLSIYHKYRYEIQVIKEDRSYLKSLRDSLKNTTDEMLDNSNLSESEEFPF